MFLMKEMINAKFQKRVMVVGRRRTNGGFEREREREREQSFFFSPRLIFVFKFQGFKSYLFESIFV